MYPPARCRDRLSATLKVNLHLCTVIYEKTVSAEPWDAVHVKWHVIAARRERGLLASKPSERLTNVPQAFRLGTFHGHV